MRIELSRQWYRFAERVAPWLAFLGLVLWVFPPKGLTEGLASYGDPLEILWSVERHCQALAEGTLFLHAPEVLYPFGLDLRLHPHWLGVNFLVTPFCFFHNRILVINGLVLAAVIGIFAGGLSAARRLGLSWMLATLVAMSIAFYSLQFFQTVEHVNQLLGLLALTGFWTGLVRTAGSSSPVPWWRGVVLGLLWGSALVFSLYFLWLGLLLLVTLMGKRLWQQGAFTLAVGIGMAFIGLPMGVTFAQAIAGTRTAFHLHDLYIYAASPDLWPLPSIYHLWWGGAVQAYLNHQPLEGDLAMLGTFPFVLGWAGFFLAIREKQTTLSRFLGPTLIGLCLSLGIYLKWRTQLVHVPGVEKFHTLLWQAGYVLKPALFSTAEPFPWLRDAFPLPGFLWVLLPFAEGGRAMVRYLFIAAPGLYLAAGYLLSRISRRWLQALLGILWASELLLAPVHWKPLDVPPHPALEWLARQPVAGAVLSLNRDGIAWSGSELWASSLHHHPLVHASGWWIPPRLRRTMVDLTRGPQEFEKAIYRLRQLGLEYLLIHRDGPWAETMEQWARASSQLTPLQCFAPFAQESPWPAEICVFHAQEFPLKPGDPLFLTGWSTPEPWGVWAEGEQSEFVFRTVKEGDDVVLDMSIFPFCVPQKRQHIKIWVNGRFWRTISFKTCDPVEFREVIPREMLQRYNLVAFQYAYAIAPAEIPGSQNGDRRRLSVGFTRLQVELLEPPDG